MKNRKGFTLIELLVVIAIIGILSTIAVIALQSARGKSRDAKRIADVKQIQTALEMYYSDQVAYPTTSGDVNLGIGSNICLSSGGGITAACSGTTIYMQQVPRDPGGPTSNYIYNSSTASTYTLRFTLEGATGGFTAGTVTASPAGMSQ